MGVQGRENMLPKYYILCAAGMGWGTVGGILFPANTFPTDCTDEIQHRSHRFKSVRGGDGLRNSLFAHSRKKPRNKRFFPISTPSAD